VNEEFQFVVAITSNCRSFPALSELDSPDVNKQNCLEIRQSETTERDFLKRLAFQKYSWNSKTVFMMMI